MFDHLLFSNRLLFSPRSIQRGNKKSRFLYLDISLHVPQPQQRGAVLKALRLGQGMKSCLDLGTRHRLARRRDGFQRGGNAIKLLQTRR